LRKLIKGNEAMAEGAVIAGCRYYFGYPITPQNEVPAYMSKRLPEVGGVFVQAESELASINMVYGASAAGARVMTTTSSPGFSLMMEGVSYLAASRLPCVLANVQRGGPGLGNIAPAQGDYFQAVKGGGHGDYKLIVLAPASPQEMMDLTILAFELSDKYRVPALILSDGIIGQMMESVDIPDNYVPGKIDKPWALTGARGRSKNVVCSLFLDENVMQNLNTALSNTYEELKKSEVRYESFMTDDAEAVIVAFGTPSRIAKNAVLRARAEGFKAGLLRPISLFPFPEKVISSLVENNVKNFLVTEMNSGQMLEDVKLSVSGRADVHFYGTTGGVITDEDVMTDKIIALCKGGSRG